MISAPTINDIPTGDPVIASFRFSGNGHRQTGAHADRRISAQVGAYKAAGLNIVDQSIDRCSGDTPVFERAGLYQAIANAIKTARESGKTCWLVFLNQFRLFRNGDQHSRQRRREGQPEEWSEDTWWQFYYLALYLILFNVRIAFEVPLGTPEEEVRKLEAAKGREIAGPRRKVSLDVRQEMADLHQAGWSFRGIARKFGEALSSVFRWVNEILAMRKEHAEKAPVFIRKPEDLITKSSCSTNVVLYTFSTLLNPPRHDEATPPAKTPSNRRMDPNRRHRHREPTGLVPLPPRARRVRGMPHSDPLRSRPKSR